VLEHGERRAQLRVHDVGSRQVPPGHGAGKLAEARRGSYSDARPSSSSLLTSSGEAIRAEAVSDRIRTPPWLCAYARAGVHASKSAPVTIPVRPSVKSRAARASRARPRRR
jgi:hypothetical protein